MQFHTLYDSMYVMNMGMSLPHKAVLDLHISLWYKSSLTNTDFHYS